MCGIDAAGGGGGGGGDSAHVGEASIKKKKRALKIDFNSRPSFDSL